VEDVQQLVRRVSRIEEEVGLRHGFSVLVGECDRDRGSAVRVG
jgi:hypothetical protein